ncbi:2'-5' RNA ligase [Nocardioides cavernae]|uniref:2'-5' RNA ligase n=1 Tax=Nocardioides cavernae TaxID=1921566 RepID=A0A7Y9KQK6_9ACTN|nr:2'-5' RNA ligase family protein [Nocardioides cavernae]NYE35695.1 2'-5' RNA ligase [Nocardioides cavernae]
MPRMHAFELLPDEAGCELVRRDWRALRDAGLPSQLDHRGTTNSPHVTLAAAPAIGEELARAAAGLLAGHLPAAVRTSGLALFGDRRVTLVRLLTVPDAMTRAVLDLRAAVPDVAHLGWLPHVTLARRVEPADVARALAVVTRPDEPLSLTTLRHWDPDAGIVTIL